MPVKLYSRQWVDEADMDAGGLTDPPPGALCYPGGSSETGTSGCLMQQRPTASGTPGGPESAWQEG